MKDMELSILYLLHGPQGLPRDITERLSKAASVALAHGPTQERFVSAGMQAWTSANTPETARGLVEAELARFKGVGVRTGIKITG
jgi:hypothetical protein